MDIKVGNVFQKTGTDELFKVVEIDSVRKTAILQSDAGESKAQSFTTLKDKRRWVPLQSEVVAEDTKQDEEPSEAKIEEEPKKSKKADNAVLSGVGVDIKEFITETVKEMGAEVSESSGRFISFKTGGKMFAAIFSYSKKSLTLGVRGQAIEGKTNPDTTVNHMMDARFKFNALTDNVKELIPLILNSAFEYQQEKIKKKEDK